VFFVFLSFIHWIAIYPVDRVIHPLNNQALGEERMWQLLACRTSFHRTFDCRVGGLVCIMLSCIRLFTSHYPPPARCVNGHEWTKNMLVETLWLTSLSFGGGGGEESSSVPNPVMSQKSYLGTGFDGHHFCTLFTLIVLGEFRLYSFVNLLYYFLFLFFLFLKQTRVLWPREMARITRTSPRSRSSNTIWNGIHFTAIHSHEKNQRVKRLRRLNALQAPMNWEKLTCDGMENFDWSKFCSTDLEGGLFTHQQPGVFRNSPEGYRRFRRYSNVPKAS